MEALAQFFEAINKMMGVSGPKELVLHPVFIGLCVGIFIYAIVTHMKYIALGVGGLMGSAVIISHMYPKDTSNLGELITFVAALGGLALVLVYIGFIRE